MSKNQVCTLFYFLLYLRFTIYFLTFTRRQITQVTDFLLYFAEAYFHIGQLSLFNFCVAKIISLTAGICCVVLAASATANCSRRKLIWACVSSAILLAALAWLLCARLSAALASFIRFFLKSRALRSRVP